MAFLFSLKIVCESSRLESFDNRGGGEQQLHAGSGRHAGQTLPACYLSQNRFWGLGSLKLQNSPLKICTDKIVPSS